MQHLIETLKTLDTVSPEHFAEEYGVNVNIEGNLYQFKYLQLSAKWNHPLVHECRGVILRNVEGQWEVASLPFDKFFNQHEGHCPVFNADTFARMTSGMEFHEKADGTCIQLWWDTERKLWRASTLGTITPSLVMEEDYTFDTLFDNVSGVDINVREGLNKNLTYVFELCAEVNRIVTKYNTDHCVLLSIRDKRDGTYLSLEGDEARFICENANVRLPVRYSFTELGISTLEEAKAFVEEAKNDPRFGEWPEGFVIYFGGRPIAKMKNTRYVQLHHVGGGDFKATRNRVIEAYFDGNLDDVYGVLTDRMKAFADDLKEQVIRIESDVMAKVVEVQEGAPYETQKDYALKVVSLVDRVFHGFFFQQKDAILNHQGNLRELFQSWLSMHQGKFNWKGV